MSQNEWSPPALEPVSAPKPPWHFIILALLVPVMGMVGVLLADSLLQGLVIGFGMVFLSSLFVYLDARQLGNIDAKGKKQTDPLVMMVASWVLWIVFYPWSFVRRARITKPNLSLLAVLVAALFAVGPFLFAYLVPPGLPACDSKEVKQLLQQIVRGLPMGAMVTSMDGHQQLSFDAQKVKRLGQCELHIADGGTQALKYIVEWQDSDKTRFYVKIVAELPACDSIEVRQLIKQLISQQPVGALVTSIDGHKELSFDQASGRRIGECILHSPAGDKAIKYLIKWQDQAKTHFLVELNMEL